MPAMNDTFAGVRMITAVQNSGTTTQNNKMEKATNTRRTMRPKLRKTLIDIVSILVLLYLGTLSSLQDYQNVLFVLSASFHSGNKTVNHKNDNSPKHLDFSAVNDDNYYSSTENDHNHIDKETCAQFLLETTEEKKLRDVALNGDSRTFHKIIEKEIDQVIANVAKVENTPWYRKFMQGFRKKFRISPMIQAGAKKLQTAAKHVWRKVFMSTFGRRVRRLYAYLTKSALGSIGREIMKRLDLIFFIVNASFLGLAISTGAVALIVLCAFSIIAQLIEFYITRKLSNSMQGEIALRLAFTEAEQLLIPETRREMGDLQKFLAFLKVKYNQAAFVLEQGMYFLGKTFLFTLKFIFRPVTKVLRGLMSFSVIERIVVKIRQKLVISPLFIATISKHFSSWSYTVTSIAGKLVASVFNPLTCIIVVFGFVNLAVSLFQGSAEISARFQKVRQEKVLEQLQDSLFAMLLSREKHSVLCGPTNKEKFLKLHLEKKIILARQLKVWNSPEFKSDKKEMQSDIINAFNSESTEESRNEEILGNLQIFFYLRELSSTPETRSAYNEIVKNLPFTKRMRSRLIVDLERLSEEIKRHCLGGSEIGQFT